MEWSYTWGEVLGIREEENKGIAVMTHDKKKGVMSLFSAADTGKVLLIPERETRKVC